MATDTYVNPYTGFETDEPYIQGEWELGPFGTRRSKYTWLGRRRGVATSRFWEDIPDGLKEGDQLILGELRLRIVDNDPYFINGHRVIQELFGWRFYLWRERLLRLYDWTRTRIILTCYVWGLAGRYEGTMPVWRDIYAVDWLCRLFERD